MLVKVNQKELEDITKENLELKQFIKDNSRNHEIDLVSKDKTIEALKTDLQMLKIDLQKKSDDKERVEKCNGEIKNENRIFEKRLLKYLDQREPVTYQCSLCEFGSGYRDKITKHMVTKHMKDCKCPDLEDNVEDCAYCRKYFSSVKDFKKHQEETLFICGMCGKCMTQDSPSLNFVQQ